MVFTLKALVRRTEEGLDLFIMNKHGNEDLERESVDYLRSYLSEVDLPNRAVYVTLSARETDNFTGGMKVLQYLITVHPPEESFAA